MVLIEPLYLYLDTLNSKNLFFIYILPKNTLTLSLFSAYYFFFSSYSSYIISFSSNSFIYINISIDSSNKYIKSFK